MQIETLALAAVIIFVSHVIKGATGFANALIAIPLLSLFLDIKFVVPMFLLFDFPSSGMISYKHRQAINWKIALTVFSGLLIGTLIGAYFLINLSGSLLKIIFGLFVICFGINLIIRHHDIQRKMDRLRWGVLTGFLGGTTGGMFGMDGPIIVVYLSRQLHKTAFRATLTTIFLMSSLWRGTLYIYGGILGVEELMFALGMIPALIAGVITGTRIQHRLSQRTFTMIIGTVVIVAGFLLLF